MSCLSFSCQPGLLVTAEALTDSSSSEHTAGNIDINLTNPDKPAALHN